MIKIDNVILGSITYGESVIGKKPNNLDLVVLAQEVKNILIDKGIIAEVLVNEIEVDNYV